MVIHVSLVSLASTAGCGHGTGAGDAGRATTTAPGTSGTAASPSAPQGTAAFDATDDQAFTQRVAQLFDDEAPDLSAAVVGPLAIQLVPRSGADKQGVRVSLQRVSTECKAAPATCEPATRDFVKKSVRSLRMNGKPATRDDIVAVLRSKAYVDKVGGAATTQAIIDPFLGDLYVVYMVDLPDSIRSLTPAEMDPIVPDRRALPQVAEVNLAKRLGHLTDAMTSTATGSFAVLQSHNVFESSRILMGDEWAVLQKRVGSAAIVVAAPAVDVMLVGIGPTASQLAEMHDTAKKMYAAASRPLSPDLFRWSATTWTILP
ncbi:MAG TPA: hypothetical protein VHV30_09170 [Polyangiaceae bacterium]|nr:hypothetical protein [Polyangiaceae bacterium]